MSGFVTSGETHVHGSAVALGECGVLIRGASGSGKSALALAVVEAWRGRGDFACLVGDDRVRIELCGGRALMSPHRSIEGAGGMAGRRPRRAGIRRLRRARPDRRSGGARGPRLRAAPARAAGVAGRFHGAGGCCAAPVAGARDRALCRGDHDIFAQSCDKVTGFAHFACQVGRKHQNGRSEIRRFRGRFAMQTASRDDPRLGSLSERMPPRSSRTGR